jgi:hypothetical protein
MTQLLDRLVGMTLLAADSGSESVELQFTACEFSAYSKSSASGPLVGLVGKTVRSVVYSSSDSLAIDFGAGESFNVSLASDDYVGPEAFCARFADGQWVLE